MKSSLETLLDDKIIVNRPRKNHKSGESYCILDNENIDSNSDNKTESKTSNLYSKANEPSTPINISSVKCVCSCHKEIEQLKSGVLFAKAFLENEIEDLKAVFSSSNDEESNDIIKILAGNVSTNVNKPQNTDFSLQRPQNDLANSETSVFSAESRRKSISSISTQPVKLNKGDTKNNSCTSQFQFSLLNNQNKSLNPSSNRNQNQKASSSESESLPNTSSRQSSLTNSKIESKKDVIIIGDSKLNGINEEGLSDDTYKVNVKIHSGTTTEDICDFIKPEVRKKQI